MQKHLKNDSRGFTLIELIITVAIIGIITAAAWPSYDRYLQKNRRTDGVNALLQNSSMLEKCFINNSTYTGCTLPTKSPRNYYNITNTLATETYTLTATPDSGSSQADDGECATLTINELGVKGFTTTNVPPDPIGNVKRCWSQ